MDLQKTTIYTKILEIKKKVNVILRMSLYTSSKTQHIDHLISEFNRYKKFSTGMNREFIFTTFFEKLVKILGWDPWNSAEYVPFTLTLSHEVHYGARLLLPNGEYILTVVLDEAEIFSENDLKTRNVDMSFAVREAFMDLNERFSDEVKFIWFTSFSRNYIYHYPEETPLIYFEAVSNEFDKLRKNIFTRSCLPLIRYRIAMETGMNLALWLHKWETRLAGNGAHDDVKNLLDFLIALTFLSRSRIQIADKDLLENLLNKYLLSIRQQFILEVDFRAVVPQIIKRYRSEYNFNFYPDMPCLGYIKNDELVKLVEEIVCHSTTAFSLESVGLAYHLLQNQVLFNHVMERKNHPHKITKIPVFHKIVEMEPASEQTMLKRSILVDGNDIGLVLGTYDTLERLYGAINEQRSRTKIKREVYDNCDLFGKREIITTDDGVDMINIPCQIIEHNLRIAHCPLLHKRLVTVMLIKKIIQSIEKNNILHIRFPSKISFV